MARNAGSHWPVFFKVNRAAPDTDNNKLHNEKTIKDKRYDRLKRKRIYQTSWNEKNPWVETSALKRKYNLAEIKLPGTFSVLYLCEVNIWGKYCRIYPEFAHKKNKYENCIFKNFCLNIYSNQTDVLYHFIILYPVLSLPISSTTPLSTLEK